MTITVEGTDQTQIFRALMCLYLGMSTSAPSRLQAGVAVIWAVFFMLSIALGRVISLVVDGAPSRLLDLYLGVEVSGGLLGLAVLALEHRKSTI